MMNSIILVSSYAGHPLQWLSEHMFAIVFSPFFGARQNGQVGALMPHCSSI